MLPPKAFQHINEKLMSSLQLQVLFNLKAKKKKCGKLPFPLSRARSGMPRLCLAVNINTVVRAGEIISPSAAASWPHRSQKLELN